MCDTLVALGNCTAHGNVIFAKNSDRQPQEPHILIRIPRTKHAPNSKVKCTYIEVEQVRETYEVLLLKPAWIYGAEMGCNQWGVNIGNEAVFTKEKYGKPALIGMDMLRLALERSKTAYEALEWLIHLLQKYGQGGNCGYKKKFVYHNSFLIADNNSAWLLETAGEYWAAKEVKDIYCISNRLSIGNDYDSAHPDLVSHALDKGWCKSERDFDFARCYSEPVFTYFSGAKQRYQSCHDQLEQAKGKFTGKLTEAAVMKILRSHDPKLKKPYRQHSLKSICMHGGFIFGDHTTGSYVASISKNRPTYWLTGSSTPCISIYKPYWLTDHPSSMVFSETDQDKAVAYWQLREQLHYMVIQNQIIDLDAYLTNRDQLEQNFMHLVAGVDSTTTEEELNQIMDDALAQETALIETTIAANAHNHGKIKGNPYYRHYWHQIIRDSESHKS